MNDQTTLTGAALERALREGGLTNQGVVLSGMVKASDKPDHIAFAAGDCSHWVDVPTELIEEAERIGQRPCRDHSHPVVRLRLKPETDEGKLLLALVTPAPAVMSDGVPGLGLRRPRVPGNGGQPPLELPAGLRELEGRPMEAVSFRKDGGDTLRRQDGASETFYTHHQVKSGNQQTNLIKVKWKCYPCRRCFRWNDDWCFDSVCCDLESVEIDI